MRHGLPWLVFKYVIHSFLILHAILPFLFDPGRTGIWLSGKTAASVRRTFVDGRLLFRTKCSPELSFFWLMWQGQIGSFLPKRNPVLSGKGQLNFMLWSVFSNCRCFWRFSQSCRNHTVCILGCSMNTRWVHLLLFSRSCSVSMVPVTQMLREWDSPPVCQDNLRNKITPQPVSDLWPASISWCNKSGNDFCFDADCTGSWGLQKNKSFQFVLELQLHSVHVWRIKEKFYLYAESKCLCAPQIGLRVPKISPSCWQWEG